MSGTNYFFDTNAIISLLKGNRSFEDKITKADWLGVSAISLIEFLAFPGITENDINSLKTFAGRISVVAIPSDFFHLHAIADFKREARLKLPDAIIGFSAIQYKATLITNDNHFKNIQNLPLLNFE